MPAKIAWLAQVWLCRSGEHHAVDNNHWSYMIRMHMMTWLDCHEHWFTPHDTDHTVLLFRSGVCVWGILISRMLHWPQSDGDYNYRVLWYITDRSTIILHSKLQAAVALMATDMGMLVQQYFDSWPFSAPSSILCMVRVIKMNLAKYVTK